LKRFIDELMSALIRLKYPDYGKRGVSEQDKNVAAEFGVSPAAFSNYKTGKRTPDARMSMVMSTSWADSLSKIEWKTLQGRLREGSFDATARDQLKACFQKQLEMSTSRGAFSSLVQSLDENRGSIRVSAPDYEPFSGASDRFFNRLYRRFAGQLGISSDETTVRSKFNLDEELRSGETHLALCYFQQVSRREAAFTPTPLRVNLSAVIKFKDRALVEEVARAVSSADGNRGQSAIRPIVVRNEAGYVHCVNTLAMKPDELEILEELNLNHLAEALRRDGDGSGVRTVVIDEFSAIQLLNRLGSEALLAVPLTSIENNRHSKFRRELPQYYMSFATPRADHEFSAFFERRFAMFLRSELETSALALADLFWNVEDSAFKATQYMGRWTNDVYEQRTTHLADRRILARQYALYTLGLDQSSIEIDEIFAEEWRRILKRARAIVLEQTVAAPGLAQTEEFIHEVVGGPFGQISESGQMLQLRAYTDHDLKMGEFRGCYEDEVLEMIRLRLNGRDAPETEITVEGVNPTQLNWAVWNDFNVNGAVSLLSRLANMYDRLPTKRDPFLRTNDLDEDPRSVACQIREEIHKGMPSYSRIFLAIAKSGYSERNLDDPQHAGIICIREAEKNNWWPDDLGETCELRYLWVTDRYRGQNVSRILLGTALNWCRQQEQEGGRRYKQVWLAILPHLVEAIVRVRRMRFREAKDQSLYETVVPKGRIVFERNVEDPSVF